MSSYYNQPWQGFVEVATRDGWTRISEAIGSVEAGLDFIQRQADLLRGHEWRIVDLGGNTYEQGVAIADIIELKSDPIPPEVTARQIAFYKEFIGAPVHIAEAERRRLLEEALEEKAS